MYRFHRVARAKPERIQEAFQFAREVSEHINRTFPPVAVEVFLEIFGENATLHWYTDHPDLASMEKVGMKVMKDETYRRLMKTANEVLVDGSIRDTLMQSFRLSEKAEAS